ncbi:MAG: DNA-processing protein DprA [Planctomycetes bacterium]|nr:DNA-processing protein DprA [Planctomycetota bacterium]
MPTPPTEELRDMLALTLVPGLGPRLTAALLERFGSAGGVRRATLEELGNVHHIGEKLARSFHESLRKANVDTEVSLVERFNVTLLGWGMPDYPKPLSSIDDSPYMLYVRGEIRPTDANAVAIVGSRQCTPYGKRMAEKFASGLVRAGFTVVSGLARGIDGAAHQGALSAGGRTIAVLAGGLSAIYPPEHDELAKAVEASGALVSETPMGMQPLRGMFHARNRLISGLSRAVVVIEANDRSGALITARHAAEQGRELFALPANVDSPTSAGSLKLLRDGARPIRDLDDLLEDLNGIAAAPATLFSDPEPTPRKSPALEKPAEMEPLPSRIWDLLFEPKPIDELVRELSLTIAELSRLLMTMELKKQVRRLPGNIYERR